MVELFEQDVKEFDRQSSKGNQLKWESDGIWYKADYTGYEGLTEYIISQLLVFSSLEPSEYARYDLEQIRYKRKIYNGASSRNFLADDWQIITLERLFKNFCGESLTKALWHLPDEKKRVLFLVEQIQRITGLTHFGEYLDKLFTIDALFLNEDRHMHNIAVLMNGEGQYAYCPIFDNGAGLMSDTTQDYPLNEDIYEMLGEVKAKTISTDFDRQLDIAEQLYGEQIYFNFTKKDVKELIDRAVEYPEPIRQRVEDILYSQMNKYRYLFKER